MDEQTELAQAVQHKWMTRAEVASFIASPPAASICCAPMADSPHMRWVDPGRNRIVRFKRDEVEAALRPIDV